MQRRGRSSRVAGAALAVVALFLSTRQGTGEDAPLARPRSDKPAVYWAYRPVERPAIPAVQHSDSARTPIDAFILARLEAAGLELSPPAEKRDLIRRATFDLLGLPPTPDEIEQFLSDTAPDAYERLLDRLLESPHYGERWGRMWLDVVRYSDTAGYNGDPLRPFAYKYRDYVIDAFNRDLPYDRFVQEQLAGDELFPDDADAQIATGFNRLPPDEQNASNVLLARQDMLNDLTVAAGSIFLAQSVGCAQCHDHKFDAITQKDFYRLQAFFAGVIPADSLPVGTVEEWAAYQRQLDDWLAKTASVRDEYQKLEWSARAAAYGVKRTKFPEIVWQAISTPPEERTALQHQLSFYSERQVLGFVPNTGTGAFLAALSPEQKLRFEELKAERARVQQERPTPLRFVETMGACDGSETPKTHLLAGGSYNKPREEVQPGFLSALAPAAEGNGSLNVVPPRPGTIGRRATLARWLTDPANPLPARVMANRVWQGHFGHGLAENANDFGVQSAPPTHPQLLDWLAAEFVSPSISGAENPKSEIRNPRSPAWSLKRLHKLIMLSAVYRQATERLTGSQSVPPGASIDPGDKLYWHFPRRRLEAESLRDALLAVSGLLNPKMHGPGVRPELPPGFSAREAWAVSTEPAERNRRSVYILAKRNLPYPLLQAFDLPDAFESCARRPVTTTAPQALMLLNSDMVVDFARSFAGRMLAAKPQATDDDLVRAGYVLAFGREPLGEEARDAVDFLARQQALIAARLAANEPVLLPRDFPKFSDPARAAALVDLCHALLNANEFVYLD